MAFYLGIDGGGSKTLCLIGDESSVLGDGSGGGSNVVHLGETRAAESLAAAIKLACAAAGISPSQIACTCMGASGGARPQIADVLRRVLGKIVGGKVLIVGDMEIALESAFDGGPGLVVIAGTGSIAYGRNQSGETLRVGGWGHAISDEGSGDWIGRHAVAAALREFDESERSDLLTEILKFWKLESRENLVILANASPAPEFASLFPLLVDLEQVNAVARQILIRAGKELAKLAEIAIRRLTKGAEAVPVAMTGGVSVYGARVREAFYNELTARCPAAVVRPLAVAPVKGALAMARRGTPSR
jgi:glucosamine kinase